MSGALEVRALQSTVSGRDSCLGNERYWHWLTGDRSDFEIIEFSNDSEFNDVGIGYSI